MGKQASYDMAEDDSSVDNCCSRCTGRMKKVSDTITWALEKTFYKLGEVVALHPIITIISCLVFCAIFVPGAFMLTEETRREKLWVPHNAEAMDDYAWVQEYFPEGLRDESFIITAPDVLEPNVLQRMIDLDIRVKEIEKEGEYSWDELCFRVAEMCLSNSILELWSFNKTVIYSLTKDDILHTVNTVTVSPVYNREIRISQLLGDIKRDSNDEITGASAAFAVYYLASTAHSDVVGQDPVADAWEQEFLDIMEQANQDYADDVDHIYYYAVRSFDDVSAGAVIEDIYRITVGYTIVYIYVSIILGKFNWLQLRFWITLIGVICVGMAFVLSVGFGTYADVMFTEIHYTLPFLVIGIGVDDMFVMTQSWETQVDTTSALTMPERIGMMMKRAGTSITVTTLTDVLALGIGAITVIPAISSFCIYVVIGLLATFLFQVTMFVASFSLDERRFNASRNSLICCYRHKEDYQSNDCSKVTYQQKFFEKIYAPYLLKLPVKIAVMVVTAILFGFGIYGAINLEQDFNPYWFLPTDSYAYDYHQQYEVYFPDEGIFTEVYLEDANYSNYADFTKLKDMYQDIVEDPYTRPESVDAWYVSFEDWLIRQRNGTDVSSSNSTSHWPDTEEDFYRQLWLYICEPPFEGLRYKHELNATYADSNDPLIINCSETMQDFRLKASRISLQHIKTSGSPEKVAAMDSLRGTVEGCGGAEEGRCFAFAYWYLFYETDKVIQHELYRNLALAFLCIFLMTLLLICDLVTCIFVSICVIMSVVDVAGVMHAWGMTVDTVTTAQFILTLGLTVDYAAHVGHIFMTIKGTSNERAKHTLTRIGAAVFNGGFSTFLAFTMLANSSSYIFQMFFKMIMGVVMFGLFHGLVFLPVLLSWFGMSPYSSATSVIDLSADNSDNKDEQNLSETAGKSDSDSNSIVHLNYFVASGKVGPEPDLETSEGWGAVDKVKIDQDDELGRSNKAFDVEPENSGSEMEENIETAERK